MKVQELAESGMDFEEVVEKTEEFIRHQDTMFVLENLDTLRKNGRLSGMKAGHDGDTGGDDRAVQPWTGN